MEGQGGGEAQGVADPPPPKGCFMYQGTFALKSLGDVKSRRFESRLIILPNTDHQETRGSMLYTETKY
jgi:hypothetical protein